MSVEDALEVALRAHRGQVDKGGHPYVLHPLRLAVRMRSETAMLVALLHDVVEDSDITLEELRRLGFPAEVVDAVDCLTRRDGETYEEFVRRIAPNELARAVKLADLEDNMDLRRIGDPTPADLERLRKYRRAWSVLTGEPVAADG